MNSNQDRAEKKKKSRDELWYYSLCNFDWRLGDHWSGSPTDMNLELGTWNLEPGIWNLEPGTWLAVWWWDQLLRGINHCGKALKVNQRKWNCNGWTQHLESDYYQMWFRRRISSNVKIPLPWRIVWNNLVSPGAELVWEVRIFFPMN